MGGFRGPRGRRPRTGTGWAWAAAFVTFATLYAVAPHLAAMAPFAALFNRLNRAGSFDNDTRRRIFEQVRQMPGSSIADIATSVGVSHSTASYHLDKLLGFNLVTSTADGNKVRYFVNGGVFTEEERRVVASLDHPETRRVLATIVKNPMCYRAELTTLLGVSPPTVSWHLERLVSAKLVQEQRVGRHRQLFADRKRVERTLRVLLDKLNGSNYETKGLVDLLQETVT